MDILAAKATHGAGTPAALARADAMLARRAARRRPLVMAALHIVLVWAMATGVMWQNYRDSIESWKAMAGNVGLTVAAHARQTQNAAGLVLASMADWAGLHETDSDEQFARVMGTRAFYDVMRDRTLGQPQVGVAAVVARTGQVLLSTREYPPPPLNVGSGESFKAAIADTAPITSFTAMTTASADGQPRFFMTRKIVAPSGAVLGLAAVGLEPEFYGSFFRHIALGPDSWISLFRADGVLLATSLGNPALLGKRYDQSISHRLFAAGLTDKAALVDQPVLLDGAAPGRTHIVDVRAVDGLPAYVAIVVGEKAYLAPWWDRNFLIIAVALLLTGLTILAAVRALRLIEDSEAALRTASERRILEAVVETPSALTAVVDRAGRVVHSNVLFRRLLKGEADPARALLDPAVKGLDKLLAFARDGAERAAELDLTLERPGDQTLLLHFSLSRQTLPDTGECAIVVGHDETMRRQAERAIAMSGKLVTLGEMSSGIAHELSQPLNVIRMAAQNALAEAMPETVMAEAGEAADEVAITPMPDGDFRDFAAAKLRRIVDQVDRAAAIIARMRMFSRTSRDGPKAFDAREACEVAAGLTTHAFRSAGIKLHQDLGDAPAVAVGNITMIEQVIANLLTNARDAVVKGAGRPREVAMTVRRGENDRILVRVSDSGPGVPAAIRDRIFEPFFTTKPVGEGTGLGLSLAYGLVRDTGGALVLLPDGPGATFQIDLPAAPSTPPPTPS